jgi:uncharacterized RDD family membrane protein YckC
MSTEVSVAAAGPDLAKPLRRRRHRLLAGLIVVLLVMGSIPVAVLFWLLKETLDASKDAESPLGAVIGVMGGG